MFGIVCQVQQGSRHSGSVRAVRVNYLILDLKQGANVVVKLYFNMLRCFFVLYGGTLRSVLRFVDLFTSFHGTLSVSAYESFTGCLFTMRNFV